MKLFGQSRECPVKCGYGVRLKSEGHWFESQHRILDGHIFTLNYCKSYIYVV